MARSTPCDTSGTTDWTPSTGCAGNRGSPAGSGTFGPSYVGYTQWAIADVPELAAMATAVTSSQFRDPVYAGASFALHTTLAWANVLAAQKAPWSRVAAEVLRGQPRLERALRHVPLGEADQVATGAEVEFYRRWLALAGADPAEVDAYWSDLDHESPGARRCGPRC